MSRRLKLFSLLMIMMGSYAYALQSYQCWNVAYSVTTYNAQGQIIGYYESSYEECGWVEVGGSTGSGGSGGSGGGSGSGSTGCRVAYSQIITTWNGEVRKKMGSLDGARVVVEIDMDGDDIVTPEEHLDLTEKSISINYFFRTLLKKNHKAIRLAVSDGAFGLLVIDLNGNGLFDHRKELFTNQFTIEKLPSPNAAVALMQYDRIELGGNEDGVINANDYFWENLYIWIDRNQDEYSSADEMVPLNELGVFKIDPYPRALHSQRGNGYQIKFHLNGGTVVTGELL